MKTSRKKSKRTYVLKIPIGVSCKHCRMSVLDEKSGQRGLDVRSSICKVCLVEKPFINFTPRD